MKNKMCNDGARDVIQQTRSLCGQIDELRAGLEQVTRERDEARQMLDGSMTDTAFAAWKESADVRVAEAEDRLAKSEAANAQMRKALQQFIAAGCAEHAPNDCANDCPQGLAEDAAVAALASDAGRPLLDELASLRTAAREALEALEHMATQTDRDMTEQDAGPHMRDLARAAAEALRKVLK
jgi:hypothetical protein